MLRQLTKLHLWQTVSPLLSGAHGMDQVRTIS